MAKNPMATLRNPRGAKTRLAEAVDDPTAYIPNLEVAFFEYDGRPVIRVYDPKTSRFYKVEIGRGTVGLGFEIHALNGGAKNLTHFGNEKDENGMLTVTDDRSFSVVAYDDTPEATQFKAAYSGDKSAREALNMATGW